VTLPVSRDPGAANVSVSEIDGDRQRRLNARKRRDAQLRHMRKTLVADTGMTSEQLREYHAGLKRSFLEREARRRAI
jgi:hypothetical protein